MYLYIIQTYAPSELPVRSARPPLTGSGAHPQGSAGRARPHRGGLMSATAGQRRPEVRFLYICIYIYIYTYIYMGSRSFPPP